MVTDLNLIKRAEQNYSFSHVDDPTSGVAWLRPPVFTLAHSDVTLRWPEHTSQTPTEVSCKRALITLVSGQLKSYFILF